jgi:phasin family protein
MSASKTKVSEAAVAAGETVEQTIAATTKGVDHAAAVASRTAEQAAASATKVIEQTVTTAKENVTAAVAAIGQTQATMKDGVEKVMKSVEELVAFGQGNVEAFVKSGQIWTSGMHDLSKQVAATAQASFDESVSAFKTLSGLKSFKEVIDLQTSFARTSIDKAVTESGKLTDASLKLAEQAFAPISARVSLAVQKFAKPV